MQGFEEYYLYIKAVHIISIIAWMCGMLYLPRLFVYHCQAKKKGEADEFFQVMERRLLRIIINPAMILAYATGIWMIVIAKYGAPGTASYWIHAKIGLALLLSAVHGLLSRCRKKFAKGENNRSERFYRIINELITVIMAIVVLLVVLKPF